MLKVYLDPCTVNCRKVLAGLDLMGAPFELVHVDYFAAGHKKPEFLAINPNGALPAATDDGRVARERMVRAAAGVPDLDVDVLDVSEHTFAAQVAARFLDVWLEFGGRTGNPLDTILWMRNGGGKSTLIALICASIRPARNDYLATSETGRHLEDCVLGADTAQAKRDHPPRGRTDRGCVAAVIHNPIDQVPRQFGPQPGWHCGRRPVTARSGPSIHPSL